MSLSVEQKEQAKKAVINRFRVFKKQLNREDFDVSDAADAAKLTKKYYAKKADAVYKFKHTNRWIAAYVRETYDLMLNINDGKVLKLPVSVADWNAMATNEKRVILCTVVHGMQNTALVRFVRCMLARGLVHEVSALDYACLQE